MTAMSASAAARKTLARTITRRRSQRSTNAPATSANSNQGRRWATASPATWRGSFVRCAASRGPAASVTPSPRFEIVVAVHRRVYARPRRSGTAATLPRNVRVSPGQSLCGGRATRLGFPACRASGVVQWSCEAEVVGGSRDRDRQVRSPGLRVRRHRDRPQPAHARSRGRRHHVGGRRVQVRAADDGRRDGRRRLAADRDRDRSPRRARVPEPRRAVDALRRSGVDLRRDRVARPPRRRRAGCRSSTTSRSSPS